MTAMTTAPLGKSDSGPRRPPRQTESPVGDLDQLGIEEVLQQIQELPGFPPPGQGKPGKPLRGARLILEWLQQRPGSGWQDRWLASGAEAGKHWLRTLIQDDPRQETTALEEVMAGLRCLLLRRVVIANSTSSRPTAHGRCSATLA
ncbi:hypothetical protein [Amycolatopsis sp. NPDC051061]|uniref:hypothetical protein n=1 Tax=Amycolatopsis sp. NPDC051061 TaxID=3155042 RepID=UPI003425A44D